MLLIVIAIGCGFYFAQSNKSQPIDENSLPARTALTVEVFKPERVIYERSITANGNIVAWQESIIGSNLANLNIVSVNVNVGDYVKKGDVLAVLDDREIRIALLQAQAAVQEANAYYMEVKDNFTRVRGLSSSGALSEQEMTVAKMRANSGTARLQLAKSQLAFEQLKLVQTQIKAPDDGVISSRDAAVGSLSRQDQPLFKMIRKGRLEWQAEVAVKDIANVRQGAEAAIFSLNKSVINGKLRKISPIADPNRRHVLLYVDLPVEEKTLKFLKPGMFVSGEIKLGQQDAMVVAESALVTRDGFANVFVMDEQMIVHQVRVTRGRHIGTRVAVHGLAENAVVVSKGAGFLSDGDLVRLAD